MHIHLRTEVKTVSADPYEEPDVDEKKAHHSRVTGVQLSDGNFLEGDCVLVATGGLSYQATGSTGDGYRFAQETGHKVTELSPSLVPLKTKEDYIPKTPGSFPEEHRADHQIREESSFPGFRRDDVHSLWRDWSHDLICKCPHWQTAAEIRRA